MSGIRNSKRHFLVFFLAFSLIFSPVNFSFFVNISSAEAGDLMIEENTEWSGMQTISGYVSVVSGVTLTIKKGSVIEFDGQSTLDVSGRLVVEGTPSDPVIFRKKNNDNPDDYYSIISSGSIYARNISVSGGGSASEVFMAERNQRHSFFQQANAIWMYSGAFGVERGGTLDIEGANFHDNVLAVYTDKSSSDTTKVWRSKFSDNTFDFVNTDNYGSVSPDIRYNWWGSADGPERCINLDECEPWQTYKKVFGKVNVSDWAKEKDFKDPVVVIPGIMGSWKMTQKSDLELDPALGTYNGLLEALDKNGYVTGENLFPFPYEWHYSNVETAKLLKTRVDEIKAQTKWPRVDIVAHSMGGLVAREYIGILNGGSGVDQLITIGTPHNGSPKSYLIWDGGDFGVKLRDFLLEKIFQQEAEENGYASIFEYIRNASVVSVRELLPVYSYLRDKESGELRTYPDLYPTNPFLQNLKTSTSINRLAPILLTNIVGRTNNNTIEKIRVEGVSIELLNDPEATVLWGHGKPDGYGNFFGGDRGLELGEGDGTVPLESAKDIISDETIELSSGHGDLPTDAAKTIIKTLTGLDSVPDLVLSYPTDSLLLIMPFSPIDIQIISPSGKKMGKNFATGETYDEIPGAYYTGYDTENEFITVPNPEDGEYKILTQGTGEGEYRIEAVKITEGATPGDAAKESTATFTGTATPGTTEEKKIELLADDTVVSKEDRDSIAPVITIASPENKQYLNHQLLPIAYTVADNISAEANIQKAITFDGNVFDRAILDLSLQTLGNHALTIRATDEAGNVATEMVNFENTVTWTSLNTNILHYSALGLIKKKEAVRHITAYLKYLEATQDFRSRLWRLPYLPPHIKTRLMQNFQREQQRTKEILFRYLERGVQKGVIENQVQERIVEAVEVLVQ